MAAVILKELFQREEIGSGESGQSAMDVTIINPFFQSVVEIVNRMTQIVVTPGELYLKDHAEAVGDITGYVSVFGALQGGFALSMPAHLARTLVGSMLGRKVTEIDDDVLDEIGELTAQISRQALAVLKDRGHVFTADVPRIITGEKHSVPHADGAPILGIPFQTLYGNLHMEICLARLF